MTEVMVHSLLNKSFSFTGSEFNHIPSSKKEEMSAGQNAELKESFNKQMNAECDSFFKGSECKSEKDDSVVSDAQASEVIMTKMADNSSKNLVQTEYVSNENYNVLATKTTVINTTYNLIAQSTKREIMNMTTNMGHSPWPSFPNVTEAVDKSRVIVQVLKSDVKCKSQNINDSKLSSPENQSVHSFRDDLYKLLSKSQSSNVNEGENSEIFPGSDTYQDISSESQDSKMYTVKARRKRNLKFYFWNGRGAKIGDLKCVCDNLRQASPSSLCYLHYLMFNSFGLCGTALQLLETKKNINNFCGYPFKRRSEQFQKKLNCITKIPRQMLLGIHRAIFGKTSVFNRSAMIDQVINFLSFPRKCSEFLKRYSDTTKYMSEEEYAALKESALRGPNLSVVMERLPENCIRKYMNNVQDLNKNCEMSVCHYPDQEKRIETGGSSSETLPAFILNGPGTKLKYFPRISNNVQTVHEKPLKILHYILYGRIEPSIRECRRNILEFNGFSNCQQEFVAERKNIIMKLKQRELFELCQILCLRAKTCSREMRIRKILRYLKSPSKPDTIKAYGKSRWAVPITSRSRRLEACFSKRSSYKSVCERRKYRSKFPKSILKASDPCVSPPSTHDCSDEVSTNSNGWKLRDFKTISSNVECAAPSDLIELNDLLFFKTCDETEIHQKILDFSGFTFPVNSVHYHSRKTLMHYMGFCVVRKIARLLDIENWDNTSNPDHLSSNVLKFLIKKVEQDSPCSNSSLSSSLTPVNDNNLVSKPPSQMSSELGIKSSGVNSLPCSLLETCSDANPVNSKSLKSDIYQHADQSHQSSHQKGRVIIQRLSKASVQTKEMCQSVETEDKSVQMFGKETLNFPRINSSEDDSICLRDLIHHPSDQELRDLIFHLVKENLWSSTLGDLVQKVYAYYPKVNLFYRESFIKAAARQILSELRDYAVSAVKDQTDIL